MRIKNAQSTGPNYTFTLVISSGSASSYSPFFKVKFHLEKFTGDILRDEFTMHQDKLFDEMYNE